MGKVNWVIRKRRPHEESLLGEVKIGKAMAKELTNRGFFDMWEVYDETNQTVIAQSSEKDNLLAMMNLKTRRVVEGQ